MTTATMPKFEISDLSQWFPTRDGEAPTVAVQGLTLSAQHGEFVSVVGRSGCGKSTILNVLSGLLPPSGGTVTVDGVKPRRGVADVGYMFQKDLLLDWRDVTGNVSLGLEIHGWSKSEARAKARQLITRVGLEAFATHFPHQLSGGMRQRVALLRSLACDRGLLLLDEPFGALDALTRLAMQEWLLEIWSQQHQTVVFVTHDIEEAVFLSDRIVVMSERPGQIIAEVTVGLDRPRTTAMMTDQAFNKVKAEVLRHIL